MDNIKNLEHAKFNVSTDGKSVSILSKEEQEIMSMEQQMLQKHKGHEQLHAIMLFVIMIFLICSQIALVYWKKLSPVTFEIVTLGGEFLLVVILFLRSSIRIDSYPCSLFGLCAFLSVSCGMDGFYVDNKLFCEQTVH